MPEGLTLFLYAVASIAAIGAALCLGAAAYVWLCTKPSPTDEPDWLHDWVSRPDDPV